METAGIEKTSACSDRIVNFNSNRQIQTKQAPPEFDVSLYFLTLTDASLAHSLSADTEPCQARTVQSQLRKVEYEKHNNRSNCECGKIYFT